MDGARASTAMDAHQPTNEADEEAMANYRQHSLLDFWNDYRRNAIWADRSLLLFTPLSPIRKFAISLTHTGGWRVLINVMILANCVSMMLTDPTTPATEGLNQILGWIEIGFTGFFTFELALQILATGLLIPDPNEGEEVDVYFRGLYDVWLALTCRHEFLSTFVETDIPKVIQRSQSNESPGTKKTLFNLMNDFQ